MAWGFTPFADFQLGTFIIILFFYHILEYLLQRHYNPSLTDKSSFLITPPYLAAFGLGIIEFIIEIHYFPGKATSSLIAWIGFLMVIVGLVIRFMAICQAKQSFTHVVQETKRKEHVLRTEGIYKIFRHPGYFGFYVFAVGTQVFLVNPISTLVYIGVLWYFFYDRVKYEQAYLIDIFGKDYIEYMNRTPTYMPFIG